MSERLSPRCLACGGRLHLREGTFVRRWNEFYIILPDAFWLKCAGCRLVIPSAETLERMWDFVIEAADEDYQ